MARKKPRQPALEKREERVHKDLDGDGEQGERAAHRANVFGGSASRVTRAVGETPSGGFGMKSCKKCGKSHKPGHPHFK